MAIFLGMYKTINTKNIQLNIVTNCYKKYIKNKRYPSNKYKNYEIKYMNKM